MRYPELVSGLYYYLGFETLLRPERGLLQTDRRSQPSQATRIAELYFEEPMQYADIVRGVALL